MLARLLFVMLAMSLLACQPGIGDDCDSSADCSQGGERLCDTTQPGGYCTVFGCEPGSCPEDSKCVVFGAQLSSVEGCADTGGLSRFARSFCMKTCGSNDDCRSGYRCLDVGAPGNDWNAVVVDRGSGKVCTTPFRAEAPEGESDVCTAPTESSEPSGGSSGTGGGASSGGLSTGGESGGGSSAGGEGGAVGEGGAGGEGAAAGEGGASGEGGAGGDTGGDVGASGDAGASGSG